MPAREKDSGYWASARQTNLACVLAPYLVSKLMSPLATSIYKPLPGVSEARARYNRSTV